MRGLLGILITVVGFQAWSADCRWEPATIQRFEKGPSEIWFFTVKNNYIFSSKDLSTDQNFVQMQSFVKSKINPNQTWLINRQNSLFKRNLKIYGEDFLTSQAVRDGVIGQIRGINCLESLLLGEHMKRQPLQRGPTELGAYVLRKNLELLILFSSENEATVPFHPELKNYLKQALKDGWIPVYQIHSHPFSLAQPAVDILGTIAPSRPDVNLYKTLLNEFGIKQTRVMNGFDTFVLDLNQDIFEKINDIGKKSKAE